MKIGLYNLEEGKIINTALMQISTYHKKNGDEVEKYIPLFHHTYDKIYASALFDYTPKTYVTPNMIVGGSGFDLKRKLPEEIEKCDYDWSLYPEGDFSIIWFSRGCINNCKFCLVREKEGYIHPVDPKNLNPNGRYIKVQDNNFFANPEWKEAVKQIKKWKQPVEFLGVDIRVLTEEQLNVLLKLDHFKQIKIAWDNPKEKVDEIIERLIPVKKRYRFMCYVLIGFWSTEEEDMYRVERLRSLNIDPFVMAYNRSDLYQKSFSRWVNKKELFEKVPWLDYKYRVSASEEKGMGWKRL